MSKAIIYCRVSSKKQESEWSSLEGQEKTCREYCEKNSMQVLGVFKEAFTGKSSARPILEEAILNAKQNKADYFIVFDIDRFSREWYASYSEMKNGLEKLNISLRDSKNIIGENKLVIKNDIVDMEQYSWNKENPNEISEVFFSTQAYSEWKKILQRTIPKLIQLEQMGYQTRQAKYGYMNKKIKTDFWKAVIQIPHPIESKYIIDIFEARSHSILSDQQIVDMINMQWYESRRGVKLTVKQMLIYISMPIYAGIIISKWTGNNPIKAPYPWLVSISVWNQANRWKISYHEYNGKIIKNKDNRRKLKERPEKEDFIFQWMLKYEWKAMRAYKSTKNGAIYYREAVWLPNLNISQNDLIDSIWEIIKQYTLLEESKKHILGGLIPYIKKITEENLEDEIKLGRELEKLEEERKKIALKNVRGWINDKLAQELLDDNEKEIWKFQKRIVEISDQKALSETKTVELLEFLLDSQKVWENSSLYWKWVLTRIIAVELFINNKKELTLEENKLFENIRNINFSKWQVH